LSRPFPPRSSSSSASFVRVNGKIRAREVRVIGVDGKQLGILSLGEAINQARANGVDLVEIAPNATPPVCRIIDFGKFRYEQAKRDKESKKHQHANKVKEIQLSPKIDPHDLGVKLAHAIDFLCQEMKVKIVLKFRGREMAHTEFGFQLISKFLKEVSPYGHPDSQHKLVGRAINVMISPLPRNKRAKNPNESEHEAELEAEQEEQPNSDHKEENHSPAPHQSVKPASQPPANGNNGDGEFHNNPFSQLDSHHPRR
jgi:translation initiation factor IF-3